MRVIVTVSVEAGGPEQAAAAFAPLLDNLGEPVAERWEPVVYDRSPGTWMASAVLADLPGGTPGDGAGGDALAIAGRLAERLKLTGWQIEGDAHDAEAVWNRDAHPDAYSPYPHVTWMLIEVDPVQDPAGPSGGGDPVADDVFADHSLEGEAFLWTLVITMDDQWWSSTASAVVVVKVTVPDAVEAREIAQDAVAALDAAVHEEPRRMETGEWRIVLKAFTPGGSDDPVRIARMFADRLRPGGWTVGGRDCGYAVWGRGDVVTGPVREIFIAVP